MEFNVRKARKTDLSRLKEYSAQTYRDHARRHPAAFPEDKDNHMDGHFDAAFRSTAEFDFSESPNLFVAETTDGALAGYILLSWFAGRPEGKGYVGQVEDIFTIPKYRNQGVARALILEARRLVGVDGLYALQAQVWAGTPGSQHVLQSSGFTPQYTQLYYGPDRPAPTAGDMADVKTDADKRRETRLGFFVIACLLLLAGVLGALLV